VALPADRLLPGARFMNRQSWHNFKSVLKRLPLLGIEP
jgi:hypothetical protein